MQSVRDLNKLDDAWSSLAGLTNRPGACSKEPNKTPT
jgi:hypothetical protein